MCLSIDYPGTGSATAWDETVFSLSYSLSCVFEWNAVEHDSDSG